MSLIVGALASAIGFILARLITRFLAGLGVGYIAYSGLEALVQSINDFIIQSLGSVPAEVFQALDVMQVFTAINLILSAQFARITLVPVYRKLVAAPVAAPGGA